MTPKDKALDLFNKYNDYPLTHEWKKQCALIAVDEVLDIVQYNEVNVYAFWQEVKKEIENL